MFRKCLVQNRYDSTEVKNAYVDSSCDTSIESDDLAYLLFDDDVDMSNYPDFIEGDDTLDLGCVLGEIYHSLRCYWATAQECIEIIPKLENKEEPKPLQIRIKYFSDDAIRLKKISVGDWIDLYANEDVVIEQGERHMIPLGIAMELPEGYEAHVVPRSSTFKTWGIIQTNHMGVIDSSYCGDNDQWHFPAYCLDGKWANEKCVPYTEIKKGDKICQFRIMECQPPIEFVEVDELGNEDRGGFGSTGSR